MPSESSSPDDPCGRCPHKRRDHGPLCCRECSYAGFRASTPEHKCHTFVPAENVHRWKRCGCGHPEHSSMCRFGDTLNYCRCTAVTSREEIAETCRRSGGCPEHPVPADAETAEPEGRCVGCGHTEGEGCGCPPLEPECSACGGNDPETCPFCAQRTRGGSEPEASEEPFPAALKAAGLDIDQVNVVARRPPYAVTYALASGELYEVALPGDAVATVEDGVLKISHPVGVSHIIQVKPFKDNA